MPVVNIPAEQLFKRIGRSFTVPEFEDLCFSFGIELDDVTSEKEMYRREHALKTDKEKDMDKLSDEVLYKVEIPANRYDLLSIEGLSRALKVFLEVEKSAPIYLTSSPKVTFHVAPTVASIRPFIVGAVLRNVTIDSHAYNSFLDFQDKLHFTLCRRRTLVAIGTHDLDTLSGDIHYKGVAPSDIKFRPLFQTEEFTGEQLRTLYKDTHFAPFLGIISSSPVWPVVYDSNGVVASLPPVINGEHSKLTLNTKNILVECTATDLTKAHQVLNTILTNFVEYTDGKHTVEQVTIKYPDGRVMVTPDFSYRSLTVTAESVNTLLGSSLSPKEIAGNLTRMQLTATHTDKDVTVSVPPQRTDILHQCDVIEDCGIAFGYNSLVPTLPKAVTIGTQQPVNSLSDLLRHQVAMIGFTEALTLVLVSHDEVYEKIRIKRPGMGDVPDGSPSGAQCVVIANPKVTDFEVARTTLIPGILKTIAHNRKEQLPLKLFEISDVVLVDHSKDVGARNERRLVAAYAANSGGFEVIHGLLDRVMTSVGAKVKDPSLSVSTYNYGRGIFTYEVVESSHPAFFDKRCAAVVVNGTTIGHFGLVHPEVCDNFDISVPTTVLEISIEMFV